MRGALCLSEQISMYLHISTMVDCLNSDIHKVRKKLRTTLHGFHWLIAVRLLVLNPCSRFRKSRGLFSGQTEDSRFIALKG